MDVRCDSCETEYELEDGSVTEAETSVQCTSCGHTFVVTPDGTTLPAVSSPRLGTPPPEFSGSAEPSAADWLLSTEGGETHRFRDITTLHKWIVERKVTAHDRVSQKGGPWRQLSELPELEPFLAVVAQADRARAVAGDQPTWPGKGSTPAVFGSPGRSPAPARAASRAAAIDDVEDDGDIYTSARYQRPKLATSPTLFDPQILPEEDYEPISFAPSHRGAKIVAGIMIAGLAGVAAYAGFKQPHWLPLFKRAEQATTEPPAAPPSPAPPVAAPVAPPAPPTAAATPPPATPPEPAPADPPPAPAAVAEPAPAEPAPAAPAAPAAAAAAAPRASDALASTQGKTYERLVSDADRLLENGHTSKAQKLYDQALVLQPNGVAAVTGSAFLLLDRQKAVAAISMFRRALARAPEYPPALFGLGEAYRAQGEATQAIAHYKQYLIVAPNGPDAHAARGQVRELEAGPPRRQESPSSSSSAIPPSPSAVIPTEERFVPAPAAPP